MNPDDPEEHLSQASAAFSREIKFSLLVTIMCVLICAGGIGLLVWAVTFTDGLRGSASEGRDLERVASRMLGFESRLSDLSLFEQVMYQLGGQDGETEQQVRKWYEERIPEQARPLDDLYLGILYGEAGLMDQLRQFTSDWHGQRAPRALFAQMLMAGYLAEGRKPEDYVLLQARLAEEVPTNWFYFQLAERLADRAGDPDLRSHLQSQFKQLTEPPLWKWRGLLMWEMILVGSGGIIILHMGLGRMRKKSVRETGNPASNQTPWTFQEGTAVLVRGGALSIGLMGLVAMMPHGASILEDFGFALLYLPSVLLASLLLCRPKNCSLLQVVGVTNCLGRLKSNFSLIILVVAVGLVGDWLILIGGEALDTSVHWREWFVPQLVWGSRMDLVKISIEFVVLAPVFEELIFRGVLFTTLRQKLTFPISMVASGLIFALVHGYGLVAFLTVFWSGCLWAWTYERTGSVIPGMFAHAINNGLVVYSLLAFFR